MISAVFEGRGDKVMLMSRMTEPDGSHPGYSKCL